jgi:plastocyanin
MATVSRREGARGIRRIWSSIGFCTLLLAACSSSGAGASGGLATPTVVPTAASAIDGAYVSGAQQVVVSHGTFSAIVTNGIAVGGNVAVGKFSAIFYGGSDCDSAANYGWSMESGRLVLTAGLDPCELRVKALNGTWVPVGGVSSAKEGELAVLSDGTSIARYEGTAPPAQGPPLQVTAETTDGGFAFQPTVIRGSPGQHVEVSVVSADDQSHHSFVVPGQGIDVDLPAAGGGSHLVTVTIPQSGSLTFFRRFHRSEFMLGELLAT